jgi:thermitase
MESVKNKTESTAWAKILAIFFAGSFIFLPLQNAFAVEFAATTNSFQIRLLDEKYYNRLDRVSKNIKHRFAGVASPQFKNIYTFDSIYSLNSLKNFLRGDFIYLEAGKKLPSAAIISNDPGFTQNPLDIDKQWGLAKAGFNAAWEKTTGSENNIVAIVDTGIDQTHQDLQAINFLPGFDFISNQPITVGTNSDSNGHGTLVAGILGATANNGIGITGANWQVSVMPLKSLDASGKGETAAIAEAIVWAADHGAHFLNLSIGGIGFGHDSVLAEAISYAFKKNVLIVAAAGNDVAAAGENLDQNPVFPICDDNNYNMVIGVAAVDQNDLKPEFSNYGRNCVDVTAPGKRILSTINYDPLSKTAAPNSYAYASGTSLGVPFVVGQAALIRALYPGATNIQIRDRIISTADPVDDLNLSQCGGMSCRGLLGAGRINVTKSLQSAIAQDFTEGDLIKLQDDGNAVYKILGGQKRLVSPFVYNQRFAGAALKTANLSQLSGFQEGPYITPADGTLVKFDSSPTVYIIQNGQKFPIAQQVFLQRKFSFANVNTLSFPELNSWSTVNFLPPNEGTLVKTSNNRTVYWVVGQILHPVNWNFFVDRGLNVFPIMIVPDADMQGYAKGEAYIR